MTPARRSSFLMALLLASVAALGTMEPAVAARSLGPAQGWIVAVAREGGSAIGPRGAFGPAPRLRPIPGDPAARREVRRLVRAGGIHPTTVYRHAFNGFSATLSAAQVATLRRDPAVAVLMPDVPTHVEATPASGVVVKTHLKRAVVPTGIRRVRADRGPLSGIDGVNDTLDVDVAVIDTGIFPSPELRIAGGYDCSSDDADAWRDREGHGTHVAGTIAARDDGKGVVGVAPGARLWAIKIFDDAGSGFLSQELCGFDHVLGMRDPDDPSRPRVEVINLSIGQWLAGYDDRDCGRPSGDLVHGAVCALVADGTTIVAAAGNQSVSTSTRQPAGYDELITVSALADFDGRPGGVGRQAAICPQYSPDKDDTFGDFSNFGPDVDLIAPGKCILSTIPRGWYAWSTGTSMATPHVTGAAALLAAAHPGATPGQIKAAMVNAATFDWSTGTDPDRWTDPLLDVSRLRGPPDLALVAAEPGDELARTGFTRFDVTLERTGGHRGEVAVTVPGLPDGLTAEVAPWRTTADAVSVWIHAAADAPAGPTDVTIRATDGDLVRTTTTTVRVRSGGPSVAFSAPDGGADGLRITDGDRVAVAFTETDPGTPPAERRVIRQHGEPGLAHSCTNVAWSTVGDPVPPETLDPGGSPATGWAFDADLAEDGCTRWVVRLMDADGGSARFASAAVLRDTAAPDSPGVSVRGDGVFRASSTLTAWVRGGKGSLVLRAAGRDASSGAIEHAYGPLTDDTGWAYHPITIDALEPVTLEWSGAAVDTALEVTATDATGRTGPPTRLVIKVDGSPPRASGWLFPRTGTFALTGAVPELMWRPITDARSGVPTLQRVQRQRARPTLGSCRGVAWTDDGVARAVALHDEQWDLRSGWCYRWILRPADHVGNVANPLVSGALLVDLTAPTADFRTPDEGTMTAISQTTTRVAWTELGGTARRVLERERVKAVGDTCPALGWVPQGATDSGSSPSLSTGLKAGWCYRWRLNLADSRDNLSVELSGVVRVVSP